MNAKYVAIFGVLCLALGGFIIAADSDSSDAAVTYTLHYDANGGEGAPATQSYGPTNDASHTFYNPADVPTRSGYTFLGWAFSSTSINASSEPGDPVILYSGVPNKTLYAVWRAAEITYTLTYNANGGSGAPSTETYTSPNTSFTFNVAAGTPYRTDYDFLGWSYNPNATVASIQPGATLTTTASNPYITIFAVWQYDPPAPSTYNYSIAYNANGGTGAPATQTYGPTTEASYTFTIPEEVPTRDSFRFKGWAFSSTSDYPSSGPGDTVTLYSANAQRTLYAVWAADSVGDAIWTNGQYNGKVDILYKFGPSANRAHTMQMSIYKGAVTNDVTSWNDTGYTLTIQVSYPSAQISVTLSGEDTLISKSIRPGNWSTFIISINTDEGNVSVIPIRTFASFTDYTLYENQRKTVMDFSDIVSGAAVLNISHSESGSGANSPRFSVVSTSVFLDTYGVVLYNPTINLYDYFPQYDNIRVNFYSFALYGESITINNNTYSVINGKITIQYVSDHGDNFLPGVMPNATVKTRTFELTNIYITYDGGHCFLTFVNDRFTIDLGAYAEGDESISMTGLWYFATMVYSPYTAMEKQLSDWKFMPETTSAQMVLIFIGILFIAGAAVAIHARKKGLGIIDLIIIGGALLVGLLMLGM